MSENENLEMMSSLIGIEEKENGERRKKENRIRKFRVSHEKNKFRTINRTTSNHSQIKLALLISRVYKCMHIFVNR